MGDREKSTIPSLTVGELLTDDEERAEEGAQAGVGEGEQVGRRQARLDDVLEEGAGRAVGGLEVLHDEQQGQVSAGVAETHRIASCQSSAGRPRRTSGRSGCSTSMT